jgi:hypothetical protein
MAAAAAWPVAIPAVFPGLFGIAASELAYAAFSVGRLAGK